MVAKLLPILCPISMPIYVSANRFLVIDSRGIEPLLNFFLEPSIFVNFNSIWNCIFYHFSFPFFLSMNDEFSFLFNFRNNGLILTMKRLLFFKFLFFMREKKNLYLHSLKTLFLIILQRKEFPFSSIL